VHRCSASQANLISRKAAPSSGTTVSILLDLPIVAAEDLPTSLALKQARSAPVPATMLQACSHVPVLVVDDHPVNRVVLEKQVMQLGYTVTCVASGEQALARWRIDGIGLILTDCNLPGMDGYALARSIRAEGEASRRKRTAMIACTANAFDEAADACLACGMDDYLAKPVSLERLGEVLQLWFASDASIEPHAEPPIDMDKVRELSYGGPAVERHLLEQLRATNDVDAAAMDQALAAQDMALAARSAHRMAGAGVMVGARAFAYACRTIAQASRNEDPAALTAALPLFDPERTRLSAYLKRLRQLEATRTNASFPVCQGAIIAVEKISFWHSCTAL
jgi:two-component system sensor histidine kinase EvgS